jgi:phospholipase C
MDPHERELSRRDFIEHTAYAAGLAGMAASLPAGTILAQAAQAKTRRAALPSRRNMPIDHVVILMMENRSFDHYFGWCDDADATQFATYTDPTGQEVSTRHASFMGDAQWQGCDHPDPGHGWDSGRAQLTGGFLAKGSGNDEFALSYYDRGDLGFIHDAAQKYTLYDRYFCSLLGPTWPNRYYKWSAQSGGLKNNNPPVQTLGNQWNTIFDVALAAGLDARYYNSDLPFSAVWGPRAVPWTNPIARYYADCAAGTLPHIAIVDPPFRDGGGFDGNSADEHPMGDVRLGQAFMADVVNAFVNSPNYRRGALFVVYDEWGGFFDHVTPPSVPDDRATADLATNFGQMGFRIPAVAISPYARGNTKRRGFRVDHGQYGHESILKFISYRFGLPDLCLRHKAASNIGESFDWKHPHFEPPDLPDPVHIVSKPCSFGGGDIVDAEAAHANDLAELEGLADRFGFAVGDGKPHEIFTAPDSVRRALVP